MSKKESPVFLGFMLLLIASICGLILGSANAATKDLIAEKKEAANKAAYAAVLPEGGSIDDLTELEVPAEYQDQVLQAFAAGDAGYCMQVSNKGYGGSVILAIGLDKEGTVVGVAVVEHGESAGLGANIEKDDFRAQYVGKNSEVGVSKGDPAPNEIKAISGATITSKCVTKSVNTAIEYCQNVLKGGEAQ